MSVGRVKSFVWLGDDGAVLVSVSLIDDDDEEDHPDWVVTTLTLDHNQRLVGVKSSSGGEKKADHCSF
jgi:hypothetical protein